MADESSMVRRGVVSNVNTSNHTAQVYFPDMSDMVSDWLPYLRYPMMGVTVNDTTIAGHTHGISVAAGGEDSHTHGASSSQNGSETHSHTAALAEWHPSVNDTVLVLMGYGFNSEGFILGVIG